MKFFKTKIPKVKLSALSLGLFVNRSRKSLLQDYNLIAGRIWLLFLFYLSVLPYVCYILKNN